MTIQFINTGTSPNSGDGDTLRAAFTKINSNFMAISTGAIGAAVIQSPIAPSNANTSTLWYDTNSGRTYVYYESTWVDASPESAPPTLTPLTVNLIDSYTNTTSNTVTNVNVLSFDTQSAFTVDENGVGRVIVGMNSTFKYIDIADQPGLTAVGLDTLTFIAGDGIELLTNATPGHQSIEIVSTATLNSLAPSTATIGFLYNDGTGEFVWDEPYELVNGTATLFLTTSGSIVFNDGSIQTTAWSGTSYGLTNGTATITLTTSGSIVFNDGTVQHTAWTGTVFELVNGTWTVALDNTGGITIPGDLTVLGTTTYVTEISATMESVNEIDFTDGTVQTTAWPGSTGTLYNNSFTAFLNNAGSFVIPSELDVGSVGEPTVSIAAQSSGGVIQSPIANNTIEVVTNSPSTSYVWQFNPDGSITWPDGSVQASASTATLSASTVTNSIRYGTETLSVLANGTVEFPDGSIQVTAYPGSSNLTATTAISLLNGTDALRPVNVPNSNLLAVPGDKTGDISADSTYLYYCFAGYSPSTYTVQTINTASNVYYIDILQTPEVPTPQVGWGIYDPIGGPTMVITSVGSGLFGPTNIPYWRLNEGTYANSYQPGYTYILNNPTIPAAGWAKVAWNSAFTGGSSTLVKNSGFVGTSTAITLGNLVCQLVGTTGLQLKVSTFANAYNVTFNVTSNVGGAINIVNGSNVALNPTGITLGTSATHPGDKIELILTIPTASLAYRITALVGVGFNNNLLTVEELV